MNAFNRIITRLGKVLVHFTEQILFKKEEAVFPADHFAWVRYLESDAETILQEFNEFSKDNQIPYFDDISSSQKTIVQKNKWQSLILLVFNKENRQYKKPFANTFSSLQKIDGVVSAMFSVLKPGTHISPHRGVYKGLLRCHLGLIIPPDMEQCCLKIDGKKINWQFGKCVVFDDTFVHEAFNKTNEERVILLIDFIRPSRNKWFDRINRMILSGLSRSPLVKEITDINYG